MKGIHGSLLSGVLMIWLVGVAASFIANTETSHKEIDIAEHIVANEALKQEYMIMVQMDGNSVQMPVEEYLVGVILAELPGDFHLQAKMAQAVAARTFAVKMGTQVLRHGAGTICGESSCCQGYLSEEAFLSDGGNPVTLLQAKQAVADTAGLVITYGGALIDATYFSCSGGKTEDAAAVWGAEVPYLQAVDSPGEEDAKYYTDTVRFTTEAFACALGADLSGSPDRWFGAVVRSEGGGVTSMMIDGREYTGVQLRSLLGLRSANFTITPLREGVLVTTRGYGHRVGLSQYGADAMAESGSDYLTILKHYYSGVEVVKMEKLGVAFGVD